MRGIITALLPKPLLTLALIPYHYLWALAGAIRYGFPSRKLTVIAVTGTKGKSTTTEFINALLEEAGYTTALANTIRFKVGKKSARNLFKMTMPGRMFLQGFLRRATDAGCTHAIIEMSSEGVKQSRHRFIALNALVFTNLAPEHIEAHGSYKKYAEAKMRIAQALEHSPKDSRVLVTNRDDEFGRSLLRLAIPTRLSYSLKDVEPYKADDVHSAFTFEGITIVTHLPGEFNIQNMLAAATLARHLGISAETIKRALERIQDIAGRAQRIHEGQNFTVVVDYAHTPESLEALYKTFVPRRLICVLGSTGGGRDTWKRGAMGAIADRYCDDIILTNEDPYDEDPLHIVEDVAKGIRAHTPRIIMDRREAIRDALAHAREGDAVLISGKGTDPYIMEAGGKKTPWDDATVVREELVRMRTAAKNGGAR